MAGAQLATLGEVGGIREPCPDQGGAGQAAALVSLFKSPVLTRVELDKPQSWPPWDQCGSSLETPALTAQPRVLSLAVAEFSALQ